jgi:hypothetical protein
MKVFWICLAALGFIFVLSLAVQGIDAPNNSKLANSNVSQGSCKVISENAGTKKIECTN